jgi:multiple sugar transport system substrate-binding protein
MRMSRSHAGKAILGSAVAAVLLLTGCSSSSQPTDSASGAADAGDKPVSLNIAWWGNDDRLAMMKQVLASFTEKYPNITVTPTSVGGSQDLFDRLTVDFASGGSNAPDVFALGGAFPLEYGAAGQLLDLSTVADTVKLDKYAKSTLTNATVDGTVYGLPTGGNAIGVVINATIFKNAGVALPDADWTWDDFTKAAKEISAKAGNGIVGLDLRVQDVISTYASQYGKDGVYDEDGNLAVKTGTIENWFALEKKMLDDGGLPDASVVVEHQNDTPDLTLFGTGKAAMAFAYSNQIAAYAAGTGGADVKFVTPPTDTKTTGVSVLPSQFWAIKTKTEHPKESALLVDWLLNEPEPAKIILANRGLQFNPDTLAVVTPLLAPADAQAADYLQTILKDGAVVPPQPAGGSILNELSQRKESDVLFGGKSPEQAAKEWMQELGDSLAAAQK